MAQTLEVNETVPETTHYALEDIVSKYSRLSPVPAYIMTVDAVSEIIG
jgi:hypothetical protein